ncbi:MAG: hypothetical protein R3A44_39230 [Caldilineaceae bacterium]
MQCLPDATHFVLNWSGGQFSIASTLIGEFNIYNVLCAAAVALSLDIEPLIVQRCGELCRCIWPHGAHRLQTSLSLALVVAHSPASLERALMTLRPLVGTGGRLIAIFGSAKAAARCGQAAGLWAK